VWGSGWLAGSIDPSFGPYVHADMCLVHGNVSLAAN
jgi:hypothetical protein